MKLSIFTQNRDNNFNLIRIVAAYAVLVTHSFVLAIGMSDAEPFHDKIGMTIGSIAVDIFFLTSGFLVTGSLLTRQSAIEFAWARILRIFPALIAMLLLTVFGVGLLFTTKSYYSYLVDINTYKYFLKCLTLFAGVAYELPGVFENNPYKNAVNGSLWTMPHEVWMYAILTGIWVFLRVATKFRPKAFKFTIISAGFVAGVLVIMTHFGIIKCSVFMRLFFMFFTGAAFFILKDRIILSHSFFCILATALMLAIFYKEFFFIVYLATLAYILFYVAYIPSGLIRKYNKLGDYSYGIYIYAFPVQQSTAALLPGISVLSMLLISSVITLVIAVLSWHLLEKHVLRLKGHFINQTMEFLSFNLTKTSDRTR
jgi:peptidoglycan/LPS O-acetylase OafA/YrhL